MNLQRLQQEIHLYVDAQYPIIYLHTFEDMQADQIIQKVVQSDILEWHDIKGFRDLGRNLTFSLNDEPFNLEQALTLFLRDYELMEKTLVLKDIHHYIENPKVINLLKEIALRVHSGQGMPVFIVSSVLNIPVELEKYISIFELEALALPDIKNIIQEFIQVNELPEVSSKLLEDLANALKGLTYFEIVNILSLVYAKSGRIEKKDLKIILDEKYQVVKKSGILEMVRVPEDLTNVGGLENLKTWLKRKAKVFQNMEQAQEFGVDLPKGVLAVGMPGCGKSLTAKAAAQLFEVPLLRLDMGRLLGQYVGQSEANMRRAIQLAEAISPCILWIDELEKAFVGINGSGGSAEVSTRLFGQFLTWMQEKTSPTFVIATANNILTLPPELLRKGRFDEIFFVDFPNKTEREQIFTIHLKKRRPQDLGKIDVAKLGASTDGYSGADIEGIVIEAIEHVFYEGHSELTTKDLQKAIEGTRSLSQVLEDSLKVMNDKLKSYDFKPAS